MDDEALILLREIRDIAAHILTELQGLRREFRHQKRSALRSDDVQALAKLLPSIYANTRIVSRGEPIRMTYDWTVKDLFKHAEVVGAALLEPLESVYGTLNNGASRRLGRLLDRGAGHSINGLSVERIGKVTGQGTVWAVRVSMASETQKN